MRYATRRVNTRVLPEPAPANTRTAPSPSATAPACGSFNPSRSGSTSRVGDDVDASGTNTLLDTASPPALAHHYQASIYWRTRSLACLTLIPHLGTRAPTSGILN